MKKNIFENAGIEYISNGICIIGAYILYFHLPYFQSLLQQEAKVLITYLFSGYAFLGLPYFILRNSFFPEIYGKEAGKSFMVLQYIYFSIPKIIRILTHPPQGKEFLKFAMNSKIKTALLSIIVKFFFFPLMVSFLIGNYTEFIRFWNNPPHNPFTAKAFMDWGYFVLYNLIFTIDTVIFAFGYSFEAKWLRNEIRSVDPHLSGWVVALMCYPPFNGSMGRILSVNREIINPFFSSFSITLFLRIVILLCFSIYGWATLALFTKASNLTNRGIVSSGPYKYVRHPAYIAKNIAWWFERIPTITNWIAFLSILVWNGIYLLRALTEERHLMEDPDYVQYVKKVRWRFIPGIC